MGVTETTRLPAGWYPDPDGEHRRRWWDGREWTEYTAAFQRPTSVDEPGGAAAVDAPRSGRGQKVAKPTKKAASKAKAAPGAKAAPAAKAPARAKAAPKPKTPAAAKAPARIPAHTTEPAIRPDASAALGHKSAQRLGWWLAGAAYRLSGRKKSQEHGRRAQRPEA